MVIPSRSMRAAVLLLACFFAARMSTAQNAGQSNDKLSPALRSKDQVKQRDAWFSRGRFVPQKSSAQLRRQAYARKLQMRALRRSPRVGARYAGGVPASASAWAPLGPVPLASDASGSGVQDYHQVSGRATAVAIDPADPTGNTIYIGGAQGGVWKSTNAANSVAANVTWTPITDDAETLSIGSIAIQPGNTDVTQTVILAATGEANSASDSYFGLGILRSTDGGNTWHLIPTANGGALSFSGLGGTRMAFSSKAGQTNRVVAAMATSSEGLIDGAVTVDTTRGLYTSLDSGQSWTYNALLDPGGAATDPTSSTSVVYNAAAGVFVAAVRYHGFYASPDGAAWTRLANQPSGAALSTVACPPQSTSNNRACPFYRGEISVVPGRNEMYAWYISLDPNGNEVDGGIWQSINGGVSWNAVNDSGIANCGDSLGCGVEQGTYNLSLLALPNGSDTDVYAGAINIYKCTLKSTNAGCTVTPFLNLTHALGCTPIAAPAHVHPAQHAMASVIPSSGTDSGNALLYFANDGGVYRALDGSALNTGSCSGSNAFDDLNENLGSLTQFVSLSSDPTDPLTLLGGTQGNGTAATSSASPANPGWFAVSGGDGGSSAIDSAAASNWFVSTADIAPGGLNILECGNGANCRESDFNIVVGSSDVGGDDGGFYPPYILDPQSSSQMLVGTCRLWRGPRLGGAYTALSPNFDTLGSGTCAGNEINLVRAIAAGGPTDANGSKVIYITTDGLGPLNGPLTSPTGGHVWVSTNATAGPNSFTDVTQNINPNQFPVSSVAMDTSDVFGKTAYVTIMGFTGPSGHVWKTTDAGVTWTDFTGTASGALPDSPVNTVIIDEAASTIYVGTDVGVFQSVTSSANWSEVGPDPSGGQSGFLPNVTVTGLSMFNSGGLKLLRASTYGRGVWQFSLSSSQDFGMAVTNTPQTVTSIQTATFDGTITALGGFASPITLTCTPAGTNPPILCNPQPSPFNPLTSTSFTVTTSGAIGDYDFNVQAVGSDVNATTHTAEIVLHVTPSGPDFTLTEPVAFPTVNAGSVNTSGPITVASVSGFSSPVTLSCSLVSGNGSCSVAPASVSSFPASPNVTVNAANMAAGSYQMTIQGVSGSITHTLVVPFDVADFQLSGTQSLSIAAGGTGTANFTITASSLYAGSVNGSCDISALAGATCTLSPANPIAVGTGAVVPVTATIHVPSGAVPAVYNVIFSALDTSGAPGHNLAVALTVPGVNDFQLAVAQAFPATVDAGSSPIAKITLTPNYTGSVNANCNATAFSGQCLITPANPIHVTAGVAVSLTLTVNIPNDAGPQATNPYTVNFAATDLSGAPTHSLSLPLTVIQDFSVNSSTASQTINAGQTSGPYQLAVLPNPTGSIFNGDVTLACPSGLPSGAQCNFSPNPVPSGSNDAVLSIATVAAHAQLTHHRLAGIFYALSLLVPGIVSVGMRRRPLKRWLLICGISILFVGLTSCGGASIGGGGGGGGPHTTTYTVTISGTSGSLTHNTTVQLLVTQ